MRRWRGRPSVRCIAFVLTLAACGKTGHLGEVTITPGSAVNGRDGTQFPSLPIAMQQQYVADRTACENQTAVTVPDDMMAINVLAHAALGVVAAKGTGAANMSQSGLNAAADSLSSNPVSNKEKLLEIRRAADIRQCDCLKARGWDAIPRFMAQPPEPPL